ncbi:MAG TPA: SRPBCC family protein [Solirubrobacteraceae bacterium]|nr:SRPBCC family protein [Solirubrobacteraceae bacterium]
MVARDSIEREILIEAPIDVVWAVVTQPEHVSGWFSERAEIDLRPGGAAVLHWSDHGTVHGRVERVEPPHLFSFRWVVRAGPEVAEDNATLVEFRLDAQGDATRLTVTESGFQALGGDDAARDEIFDGHEGGWATELGHLQDYLERRAPSPRGR